MRPRGPGPHAAHGPGPRPAHGPGPSNASHLPHGPAPPRSGRPRPKDRQASGRSPVRSQPHPGRDPAHAKQAARNTKGLLVYILDVPATLNQNQVVIDLARRQRRPAGDWGPLKPWWHAPAALLARYDPEDRDLLALLEEARAIPPPRPLPRRVPPRRWSTSMRTSMARGWSATAASRWGRGGSCSGMTRRPSSSGWRGPAGSGSAGPTARRSRPRSAGTTGRPGGSRSTSAPSWGASAGPGAARSGGARRGWTWPSRSPWSPAC